MDSTDLLIRITEESDKLRSQRPEIVYHYTDFEGLRGILSSHKLWATSIRALNDGSELTFAEKVLCDHFDVLFDEHECEFSTEVKKTRKQLFGHTSFVTCFCEKDDLLSMWRGYAAHGGGYCLGFRQDLLLEIRRDAAIDGLVKLLYGDALPDTLTDTCQAIYECAVKHFPIVE